MPPSLQHGKRGEAISIPGRSQSDNTLLFDPDCYRGGLPKAVRAVVVIFQRPMRLLPRIQYFALEGLGEGI
jgi:hypothetical protein